MISTARPASRAIRSKLLISSASVAIAAVAVAPQQAHAQAAPGAFQGSPTTATGTVGYSRGSGTETITVSSPTATINWAPYDAATGTTTPINFLPNGNVATFTSATGVTDYTVLNRILPVDANRAIALNGQVISTLQGGSTTGGRIWFYSPGGILIGSSAIIDVGSLLLTTADPNSWSTTANGFTATFGGATATSPSSKIQIASGAQLKALQQGSYIALVAPRIEQGGSVRVNGSAAYVAGEQLSMTVNQGLFDIDIPVGGGTTDANGIVHTGTTGGVKNAAPSDNHSIYMVAVPKNQALTMLLDGNIGFDPPATTASVQNGQIILSAGWSVHDSTGTLNTSAEPGANGSLLIGSQAATRFTSDVFGIAKGDVTALATSGNLAFDGDLTLRNFFSPGSGDILVQADSGNSLTVGGNVSLYSTNSASSAPTLSIAANGGNVTIAGTAQLQAGSTTGGTFGTASLSAFNGTLSIAGTTTLLANAPAGSATAQTVSADNHGGEVDVEAFNGGTINTGAMIIDASANGQDNLGGGNATAGDGTGGSIYVESNGGNINVNGSLSANASGYGGRMFDNSVAGGAGYGGEIRLNQFGGGIHVTGSTSLTAYGIGGSYLGSLVPTQAAGGFGEGGFISVWTAGSGTIKLDGSVNLASDGTGGSGQTGGDGRGGSAGINGDNGTVTLGPTIGMSAIGTGGDATAGFGGNGGYAQGGVAYIEALAYPGDIETPASSATISGGNASLDVSAVGGDGGKGNGSNIAAGAGGTGQGGYYQGEVGSGGAFAAAQEPGGKLTLGNAILTSNGTGGAGGAGGAGQVGGAGGEGDGGSTQAGNYDTNSTGETTATATFGSLSQTANGYGGAGGAGPAGQGNGGAGNGGADFLNAKGIVHVNGPSFLHAIGFGGIGQTGGIGTGGLISIATGFGTQNVPNPGNSILTFGSLDVLAKGQGGDGSSGATGGTGGAGNGGSSQITVADGTLTATDVAIGTRGVGGAGGTGSNGAGGAGGAGTGGSNDISVEAGSNLNATTFLAQTNALGGAGGSGSSGSGNGGSAQSGTTTVTIDGTATIGGNVNQALASGFVVTAYAEGGAGATGGDAHSGSSTIYIAGSLTTTGLLEVAAQAQGGAGNVTGGSAFAGSASLGIDGDVTAVSTYVGGRAGGGNGGTGGDAQGGNLQFSLNGSLSGGSLSMDGSALGGTGVQQGGSADGGSLYLQNYGSIDLTGDGTFDSSAHGGLASNGLGGGANGGNVWLDLFGDASFGSLYLNGGGIGGDGANGGAAHGGSAMLWVEGSLDAGRVNVDGRGTGGNGSAGNGGYSSGGDAEAVINGGAVDVTGDMWVSAVGNAELNGDGVVDGSKGSTNGGNADGGLAAITITPTGGSLTVGGLLQVLARGTGGAGGTGTGGYGHGGEADFIVGGRAPNCGECFFAPGTAPVVAIHDLQLNALGDGGAGGNASVGGTGGKGSGGSTSFDLEIGSVAAHDIIAVARGTGGGGGSGTTGKGGNGGDGTGGSSDLTIADTLNANSYSGNARGFGGTGGSGTTGQGNGGHGVGGNAYVDLLQGATAHLTGGLIVTTSAFGGNGGNGGDADNGSAVIDIEGALTVDGLLEAAAQAFAGNGTSGSGGSSHAGTASINVTGSVTATDVYVAAQAGGDPTLPYGTGTTTGGNAVGGSASFTVDGGSANVTQEADIVAGALGGSGGSGASGTGTAGSATVSSFNGGTLVAARLYDSSFGDVGTGTVGLVSSGGGTMQLGDLTLETSNNLVVPILGTDINVTGLLQLISSLNITFGNLNVGSLDFDAGGTVNGGDVVVSGFATGSADGAVTLGNIAAGGAGNDGFSVGISSATSIDVGNVSGAQGVGFATNGHLNAGNIAAGDLFMALVGGNIHLGALTTGPAGKAYLADVSMFLDNGGGQDNFDPNAVLALNPVATQGSISITGPVNVGSFQAAAGTSFASGAINATGGVAASAGTGLNVTAVTAGQNIALQSSGTLATGDLSAAQAIDLNSTGAMTANNLSAGTSINATSGDNLTLANGSAGTDVTLTSGRALHAGNLTAGGVISLSAVNDLVANNLSATGDVLLDAGGNLTALDIVSSGAVTAGADGNVQVGNVTAGAGKDIDLNAGAALAAGNLTAGGSINATSVGNLAVGNGQAGSGLALTSGGSLSAGNLTAGGALQLSAATDLGAGSLSSGGNLSLDAGGNLAALNVTSARAVNASASGNISLGNVASGNGQDVTLGAGGDLSTAAINSAGKIGLDGGGNVATTDLTAASTVAINAGGNSSVRNVAATDAAFTAGGTANFLGIASVPTISVTSRDINVAAGGSLGVFGVTNLLTLNAVSDDPIMIGSGGPTPTAGQYVLDEAGDIESAKIVVNAVAATSGGPAPDIHIYDVSIDGSETTGGGVGGVEVNTAGSILVAGAIDYGHAGAGDSLSLNSGQKIEVATDAGGSIAMTNGAGDLAGTLNLVGHDVWVADQATLAKLEADPNYAARGTDLATNPGADNQAGFLQAGGIAVDLLGSSLMVQNSGTQQQPAGLSIGTGGLTITNEGTDPAIVILYGRQVTGSTISGGATFVPLVVTTGTFSTDSRINGCSFSGCAPPTSATGAESILGPIGLMTSPAAIAQQDPSDDFVDQIVEWSENGGFNDGSKGVVDGEIGGAVNGELAGTAEGEGSGEDGESDDASSPPDFWQGPINTGPVSFDRPIDEPVTSGSDGVTTDSPK